MKSFQRLGSSYIMVMFITYLGLFLSTEGCQSINKNHSVTDHVTLVMDSIKATFVPDRRVEIFDYIVSQDGDRIVGRSSNMKAFDEVQLIANKFPEIRLDSFLFIKPQDSAVINVSVGNVRSNPRHSAELASQVLMGQQVTVWDKVGSWYYIQSPDKYLGWIDSGALVFLDQEDPSGFYHKEKVMYKNNFGFCYKHPSKDMNVVSDLVAGDILGEIGVESSFIQVILPDGRKGFVPEKETQTLMEFVRSPIPESSQLLATAFEFMGRPYLWGGTSGKGVDCSGFTKMVYYLNGLEIPRDASQQVNCGNQIPIDDDLSQLKPGDFLFFGVKGENGMKDKITHVAIYIGDGRMIHASERVQIQSLMPGDPDYVPQRRKTLLIAKRMIDKDEISHGIHQIKNNRAYGF